MTYGRHILLICLLHLTAMGMLFAAGEQGDLHLGLHVGLNRIEGDLLHPALTPMIYGNLNYNLNDFFAIGGESGYTALEDEDRANFQTIIVPFELHAMLSFLPLKRINPYAILGGGGVYWNATQNGLTIRDPITLEAQEKIDSFLKAGGGIEFAMNQKKNLYLNIGATFRYSLTDMLDQVWSGDEKDGVIEFYSGISYAFRVGSQGDKDDDGVPDELDLAPEQVEDSDGYMDHDGKPDGVPPLGSVLEKEDGLSETKDTVAPVVIHLPVRKVEAGKDIKLSAEIFENRKLKIVSVLYRPKNFGDWQVQNLKNMGGILYQGVIPAKYVKKQGLEYCIIAVDEAMNGIGYCGLPKHPVNVKVIANPTFWRIFNGTAALMGWGAASYTILRKQN